MTLYKVNKLTHDRLPIKDQDNNEVEILTSFYHLLALNGFAKYFFLVILFTYSTPRLLTKAETISPLID